MLDNEKNGTGIEPEELQVPKLATLPVDATELEAEEKIMEGVEDELQEALGETDEREPTEEELKEIYIQQLKDSRIKFRPIKHAIKTVGTTTVVSSIGRERQVKEKAVQTNLTINQFGAAYKQKRKRRNKLAKASRKANR